MSLGFAFAVFEIEPRLHFFQRLLDRIHDFGVVNLGCDVERILLRHNETANLFNWAGLQFVRRP